MGRVVLALAWGALTVTGFAGCGSDREDTWQRYLSAAERWYPKAWGAALPDEERSQARRRFDCIWDRLDQRGPDIACVIRNMDAMVRCADDPAVRDSTVECLKPERQPCATSPAFERAASDCASEAEGRLWVKP